MVSAHFQSNSFNITVIQVYAPTTNAEEVEVEWFYADLTLSRTNTNKRIQNVMLGCNLRNDRMISVHFQGKPFNITVIQMYVPTTNAKKAEVKWFYGGVIHGFFFPLKSKTFEF